MADPETSRITGNRFDAYKSCGNDVVHFKLVRQESDVHSDDNVFKPDMTHQIFGESENIFGYRDLRVNIYCSAARLTTCVTMKYSEKINPAASDGVASQCSDVQADDVMKLLTPHLQPGFLTSEDAFIAHLSKDATFKPYGEMIHSYNVTKGGEDRTFEIYKTNIDAPGFRDFHERIQPFLLFYVDAASYIDADDEKWTYYLLFEKYQWSGSPMYAFAGYMTVYNYYAYPEKVRPRISQVLVLPPFQRQGHCATLLQTFYNDCYKQPEVLDITVEDPSENFQRVRDFVDARNCMKLAPFHSLKLLFGFSDMAARQARDKLKLNKKQARRVYEILRLKRTDPSNEAEYKALRLDIKKRLNQPFQKRGRDFDKLSKVLQPTELAAAVNGTTEEQRLEYLQTSFQELVEEYTKVVERINIGE